jgi:c-di-GMP-binding flagellar brake protein YcgR
MDVVNISISGVYCHVDLNMKGFIQHKHTLRSVSLTFTYQDQSCDVIIQSAEFRRFEKNPLAGKVGVAYEFLKIEPEENKKLIDHVYNLQRDQLRGRLD